MKLTTEAQDWSYNSSLMQNRNHHPDGQEQMTMQIERHYRMPNVKDKVKQYEFMLWMTQVWPMARSLVEIVHTKSMYLPHTRLKYGTKSSPHTAASNLILFGGAACCCR